MKTRRYSCVTPEGKFIYGIHKPSYAVSNKRVNTGIEPLGSLPDNSSLYNTGNFPSGDIDVPQASWIYEIPNPLPFRGATFIDKNWADASASDDSRINLPKTKEFSFTQVLHKQQINTQILQELPRPLLLTLAVCSTDPEDLIQIAERACEFTRDENNTVNGMRYTVGEKNDVKAVIHDHDLFEAVANNPALPDQYKIAMVLRPGAQGASEIVGEWCSNNSHIYEYLRRNSYISGGHYAANMAENAIRYSIDDLTQEDMDGLRHLYYQRMYLCIAAKLNCETDTIPLSSAENLEQLRLLVLNHIDSGEHENSATLWGWNFGFDYSPSDYRLHASHQQIHQQYAQIPEFVETPAYSGNATTGSIRAFSAGDMVSEVIHEYQRIHGSDFFRDYYKAICTNTRMDDHTKPNSSLIVWEDEHVMLFVPKAQTSQWELQIMTKPDSEGSFPGNILETNSTCRSSLNRSILLAQKIYSRMGAKLVTSIEYSKRICNRELRNQPLLYSLLPKLPYSMGAFSEAQLRYISGHYPEDFAAKCRTTMQYEDD